METKKLTDLTVTELKAAAFDQGRRRHLAQTEMKAAEDLIKRINEVIDAKEKEQAAQQASLSKSKKTKGAKLSQVTSTKAKDSEAKTAASSETI